MLGGEQRFVQSWQEPVKRLLLWDVSHRRFLLRRIIIKPWHQCLCEREKLVCDHVVMVYCQSCDRWFPSRGGCKSSRKCCLWSMYPSSN